MTVENTEGAVETPEDKVENTEDKVNEPEQKATEKSEEKVDTPAEKDKEKSSESDKDKGQEKEKEKNPEPKEKADKEDAPENADNGSADLATAVIEKDVEIKDLTGKYEAEQTKANNLQSENDNLQKVLKEVVDSKVEGLSDEFKSLMPEEDVVKQLSWLNKAEAGGLGKKENPEVEIGKPLDLGTKNKSDEKDLSAHQKIANYFGDFYKK